MGCLFNNKGVPIDSPSLDQSNQVTDVLKAPGIGMQDMAGAIFPWMKNASDADKQKYLQYYDNNVAPTISKMISGDIDFVGNGVGQPLKFSGNTGGTSAAGGGNQNNLLMNILKAIGYIK